jgi:hypothetical protein
MRPCDRAPCDFVPQDSRSQDEGICGKEQIGVTQPGCANLDEHLAPTRRGELHILELKAAADHIGHHGFYAGARHACRPGARVSRVVK